LVINGDRIFRISDATVAASPGSAANE